MSRQRTHTASRKRQQGAIAVSFIILAVLLLGFVALGMDVGRLYVSKTELQNAADSCALAASGALTGANANQLKAAEDFGIAAGQRNLYRMQSAPVVITPDSDITFSATLNGVYQTRSAIGNPLDMRYVRCTLNETGISTILLHVIQAIGQNVGTGSTAASAVASLEPSVSNCALPLAICKADIEGKIPGVWIEGVLRRAGNIEGAFKWVEFPGYERNKDLEALIAGTGQCDLNSTNTVDSHPGFIDSMLQAWDTRFGIYRPGGPAIADGALPDKTGWVYDRTTFPAGSNALDDYKAKKLQANPKHQSDTDYKLANPNQWATDEQFGAGTDGRRLAVGPVVDCQALGRNGTTDILDWACYLMLNPVFGSGETMILEYRGLASNISSGCVTSGAPGGPGAGGPKVPTLVQ
jgi:Flp pilus assembly protein TadG